jgi:dCMP deaminase
MQHFIYIKLCKQLAILSKCIKYKVACIITKNNKIIATGINGTKNDTVNCCDHFKDVDITLDKIRGEHKLWSLDNEIHAEHNAINFAKENKIDLNGTVLYCNLQPCMKCLKLIIDNGIKTVYFYKKYKNINITDYKILMGVYNINVYKVTKNKIIQL